MSIGPSIIDDPYFKWKEEVYDLEKSWIFY